MTDKFDNKNTQLEMDGYYDKDGSLIFTGVSICLKGSDKERQTQAHIERVFGNIRMEEPNQEDCVGVISCLGSGRCDKCGYWFTFLTQIGNLRTGKVYHQFCERCRGGG